MDALGSTPVYSGSSRQAIERFKRDRPSADDFVNEIFFDKKCGRNETHDRFFSWCIEAPANGGTITDVSCSGITGTEVGTCLLDAKFIPIGGGGGEGGETTTAASQPPSLETTTASVTLQTVAGTISRYFRQAVDGTTPGGAVTENATTEATTQATTLQTEPPPAPVVTRKANFDFVYKCSFGNSPGKVTKIPLIKELDEETLNKITAICDQEINGVPFQLPLWLILLIILLVILAVSGSAYIFWTMWLRRKIYGPKKGELKSALGSQWTSAPISSTSAFVTSAAPSRVTTSSVHSSKRPLSSNRLSSGHGSVSRSSRRQRPAVSSAVGSLARPSRSNSVRARQPSNRSGMSRSSSHRAK